MTPNTLAQALFELAQGRSDTELDTLAQHATVLLKKQHRAHMLPDVVRALEKRVVRADRHTKPIVTIEKRADLTTYTEAIRSALRVLGAGEDYVIREDDTLVGGFSAEHAGQRVDATYKRSLLKLYSSLVEA